MAARSSAGAAAISAARTANASAKLSAASGTFKSQNRSRPKTPPPQLSAPSNLRALQGACHEIQHAKMHARQGQLQSVFSGMAVFENRIRVPQ